MRYWTVLVVSCRIFDRFWHKFDGILHIFLNHFSKFCQHVVIFQDFWICKSFELVFGIPRKLNPGFHLPKKMSRLVLMRCYCFWHKLSKLFSNVTFFEVEFLCVAFIGGDPAFFQEKQTVHQRKTKKLFPWQSDVVEKIQKKNFLIEFRITFFFFFKICACCWQRAVWSSSRVMHVLTNFEVLTNR